MGAGHHHHEHSQNRDFSNAFLIGIALNTAFVAAEIAAGFWADSMALLADAGHNFSDVLSLALAWAAAAMATKRSSERFSYGLKKAPILASLANAVILMVAVGAILVEAVRRLFHPEASDGLVVAIVAGIGIVVNGLSAALFASGRKSDLNIRGAYLHMASDAAVSAGVLVAGAVIAFTGRSWIDPAVSILVGFAILWGTFGLLKQSVWMSLAAVPPGLSMQDVEAALLETAGVNGVHDLHIWPMSTTENAVTVHLVVPDGERRQSVLRSVRQMLHDRFHLDHATIQVEDVAEQDCADC